MKKIIGLVLLMISGMFVIPADAQTYSQDRYEQRNNRHNHKHRGRGIYHRNNNYGYIVRMEQAYIRHGRKVYLYTFRSTYNRYGQLINRVVINRQRVGQYDHYDNRRFQRETGRGFNVYFRF